MTGEGMGWKKGLYSHAHISVLHRNIGGKPHRSAVGPRPECPQHLIEFNREILYRRLRNAVKPRMAGWAVVNYDYIDNVEDAKVRLQYDLYYIKHQSIWLDLVILLRALGSVLALRGR